MVYVAYAIVAVIVLFAPGVLSKSRDHKYSNISFSEHMMIGWGLLLLLAIVVGVLFIATWAFTTVGADLFGAKAGA